MSKNLLTIEAFAEFCERKPADKEYDYCTPSECACAQYQKSLGIYAPGWLYYAKPDSFWLVADEHARAANTFGELAKRLRSLSA